MKDGPLLDTVSMISTLMEEFSIIEIRLDNSCKIVYIAYLDENLDQKNEEIRLDSLISALDNSVEFTEADEFLSDYDDPDLWQDGKKPMFEVL